MAQIVGVTVTATIGAKPVTIMCGANGSIQSVSDEITPLCVV